MAVLLAWIICPIVLGITFLSTTAYFIYKLITSQNVAYRNNTTVRTISVTSFEMTCCVGWLWTLCLDKTTNRMTLSTFIIWYIVNVFCSLLLTVVTFLLFYYGYRIYV